MATSVKELLATALGAFKDRAEKGGSIERV
jgi:hypothetical protein